MSVTDPVEVPEVLDCGTLLFFVKLYPITEKTTQLLILFLIHPLFLTSVKQVTSSLPS